MFRILKLLLYLGALAGLVWFGTNVKLGRRTLFQHVQNIWHTHESKELVEGTKGKVGELMDRASDGVTNSIGKNVTAPATSKGESREKPSEWPMENVENEDRKTLHDLIGRKAKKE